MIKKIISFFFPILLFGLFQVTTATGQVHNCREMKSQWQTMQNRSSASAQVGDTIHALHYEIHVDTIDFAAQTIRAFTELKVTPKVNNISAVQLNLLRLTVDSVFVDGLQAFYAYDDTTLTLPTISPLNIGDTMTAKIYYHGHPQQDASGWGGFYFSGQYAFNLGVGFASDPHNLGKVWFPCIDEFTDRATYEFFIRTSSTNKAFCNGELINEIQNADGTRTWNWKIDLPIPTYLACMAVAPFYTLQRDYNGLPIVWACLPADTNKTLVTFQHINQVMDAYTSNYGPYPWNKIGYTEVPFNSGAMEHASAITIGSGFINGTLTYETLWAHELSHMWWGDKVTCKTAQDMWLNEGFATYNEAFVTKVLYGEPAYKDWIRENHRRVLQYAHVPQNDGAYLTMNNIPSDKTYGFHVYQKGADVIHTLKNYMGDSLFADGAKQYMNQFAYANANSYDLRDALTTGSGIDMTRFFDDWVFTPGFPHFSIDSVVYMPGGLDHYFVYTRQRARGNNNHIYSMPVDITFSNGTTDTTVTVQIDSATQMFHIPLYFMANWMAVDRHEKISDAIVDFEKPVTTTGAQTMTGTNVILNVLNVGSASNTIRIENNFVLPDGFKQANPGIRLSDYHYWKVDGIFSSGFLSKATFGYNGTTNPSIGYLDNTLISGTEDSLVILYRQGTWDDWHIVNGYVLQTATNHFDKVGNFIVDTLKIGEYVFGYYDYTVGISGLENDNAALFSVLPNPSASVFNFSFDAVKNKNLSLLIFDERGSVVLSEVLKNNAFSYTWEAQTCAKGIYFAVLADGKRKLAARKIVLTD